MILIGLTGKARSGKDTVADYLAEHYRFKTTAFAKPIKDGCKAMFGLTDEHVYGDLKEVVIPEYGCSPRQMLQWCGTEFGREMVHPDIWLMQVRHQWEAMRETAAETFHSGLVVTDVRFENEAELIRKLGGFVVHVERPDAQTIASHSSESGVRWSSLDGYILNESTLDALYAQVDNMACKYLGLTKT